MECSICNKDFWRFDLAKHFEKEHSGTPCPAVGVISEAEKEILIRKSKNSKNSLNRKDLSKLSDSALKLLPVKDFWDSAKKEWKSNAYGTFAKQQSQRMKRLFGTQAFQ